MQDSRISNNKLYTYNIKNKQIDDKIKKRCSLLEIEKHGGLWNYKYQLCIDYELNCSDDIILNTTYKDNKIGIWLSLQFGLFNKNLLDADKLDKLNILKSWIYKINQKQQIELNKAMLIIFKNGKTYNYKTIYAEIVRRKLYDFGNQKTPMNTCNRELGGLFKRGLLMRFVYNTYYTYRLKQKIKTSEFVEMLKRDGIKNETDYRSKHGPDFNEPYVEDPVNFYENFSWVKLIDNKKYYDFDEAIIVIANLLDDEKVQFELKKKITVAGKYTFLRSLDDNLHPLALTYYDIKKYKELDPRLGDNIDDLE
jgi:hypothetical protein